MDACTANMLTAMRDKRDALGLTNQQLAETSGLSITTMYPGAARRNCENLRHGPSAEIHA